MKVRVRLFAVARELAGAEIVTVEVAAPATIGALRTALATQVPQLESILPHVLFAVDSAYMRDDSPLLAPGEVACIPPVSGG